VKDLRGKKRKGEEDIREEGKREKEREKEREREREREKYIYREIKIHSLKTKEK
jgi:hypothetical protein